MAIYIDIGAYDAKTNFSDFLRKARSGMAFRITNRGEHVADLVPPGAELRHNGAKAAQRMQQFIHDKSLISGVDSKALIEEGRD
jgi:prevent-host-death family protein